MRYTKHLFTRIFHRCAAPVGIAFLYTGFAALGGCADETGKEGILPPSGDRIPLAIEVKADGFAGQPDDSPHIRSTEQSNYDTYFEPGDSLGLFAVKNIGTADASMMDGIDNTKMIFFGAEAADLNPTWQPEDASVTLYYSADVTYIAYYPYKNGITIDPTQSADAIRASFAEKTELQPSADQSTAEGYATSDLMTAGGKAVDTTDPAKKKLTLSLTHSYSLLVVKTNRKTAKYVAPDGAFKYHSGVTAISVDTDSKDLTMWGIKAFKTEDGVFRAIIKDVSGTISGSYSTGGMLIKYNQSPTGLANLKKGKVYECTVNTPMSGTAGTKTRALQVGDFFFEGGTIWPGGLDGVEEPQPPGTNDDGSIGVVFWARNPAVGNEYGFKGDPMLGTDYPQCKNGLVLYKQTMTITRWDADTSYSVDYWMKNTNPYPGITFDITRQDVCQGYSSTKAMKKFLTDNPYGVTEFSVIHALGSKNIEGTSGFYIPSLAEASLIMHGENNNSGTAGRDLMNRQLKKLKYGSVISPTDELDAFWTSTEQTGSEQERDVMIIDNTNGAQTPINKQSLKSVRAVFAF